MRVVFVHGACVRDGAWWWHRAAELLSARGTTSVAPVLPSCGETGRAAGTGGPGLYEDVAEVRRHLLDGDEPTIVVAHSYGGMVVAEAAADVPAMRSLLLIASVLPEIGQSLADFGDGTPAPYLDVDEQGTVGVRHEVAADTFLQDCDPETTEEALARLTRQSLHATQQPARAAAWQQLPTTYLVCAEDNGTPPERQREFAQAANRVVELDAGHHPFLSQPQAVVDLMAEL